MAAESQFQAAPHRDRVNRSNHRLAAAFYRSNQAVQSRLGQRFGRIEFLDIGAPRKCLAGTGQHDGLDRIVLLRPANALDCCSARREAKAVDWGIIE